MLMSRKNVEKTIKCPKCGTRTEIVSLNKVHVNKCKAGCGVWINQSELDLERRSKSLLSSIVPGQPVGFWRARRLNGR